MSWAVIVPSNRPEEMKKFISAWEPLLEGKTLVVMWDLEEVPYDVFTEEQTADTQVVELCWKDLPKNTLIPTKTDMVRSFAMQWAYKNTDAQYFLTLDDDVRPQQDPFERYEYWFKRGAPCSEYLDVGNFTTSGLQMRGFPYPDRKKAEVAVQYGGWNGVLDFDAATQLAVPQESNGFWYGDVVVPKGAAVTCCIMNCAWKREYTPIMWQLPMLDGRYNRYGDIWSGLFIKKTLDAVGAVMVINGQAQVFHERASNPYNNLNREAPGAFLNDNLWKNLATPSEHKVKVDLRTAYREVTDSAIEFFEQHDKPYAEHFLHARNEWMEIVK